MAENRQLSEANERGKFWLEGADLRVNAATVNQFMAECDSRHWIMAGKEAQAAQLLAETATGVERAGRERAESLVHDAQAGQQISDSLTRSAQVGQQIADSLARAAQAGQQRANCRIRQLEEENEVGAVFSPGCFIARSRSAREKSLSARGACLILSLVQTIFFPSKTAGLMHVALLA